MSRKLKTKKSELAGSEADPHYKRIAATLISEIRKGNWRVGDALPSETDLVERFRVSRHTIREGIRHIQSLGYLRRRQGARSVLVSQTPEHVFVNSPTTVGDILLYAKQTRGRLLALEKIFIDPQLARRLEHSDDGQWTRALILRFEGGRSAPLCYSEVYVAPSYAEALQDLTSQPIIYDLIEQHYGMVYSRVEQEIEARAADANVASRLGIEIGSPVLQVRTKFYAGNGEIVEIAVACFPYNRYRMRINFQRNQ